MSEGTEAQAAQIVSGAIEGEGQPPAPEPNSAPPPAETQDASSEAGEQQVDWSAKAKEIEEREQQLERQFMTMQRKERENQLRAQQERQRLAEQDAQLLRENPNEFFQRYGMTPKDVAGILLQQKNGAEEKPPEQQALTRVEQLEKKLAEQEEAEKRRNEEKKLSEFRNQIAEHIGQNSEKYQITQKTENGADLVFATIDQYYSTTGELLPLDKAADLVEAHLEKQARAYLETQKARQWIGAEPNSSEGSTENAGEAQYRKTDDTQLPPRQSVSATTLDDDADLQRVKVRMAAQRRSQQPAF